MQEDINVSQLLFLLDPERILNYSCHHLHVAQEEPEPQASRDLRRVTQYSVRVRTEPNLWGSKPGYPTRPSLASSDPQGTIAATQWLHQKVTETLANSIAQPRRIQSENKGRESF